MKIEYVKEPAREVPVGDVADVVVCGAGPAGMAAALTSARAGARTLLLEGHGCLGGVWTAGLLSWVIHPPEHSLILRQLGERLDAEGARNWRQPGTRNFAYDPEVMKRLLEDLATEAGVRVRLHTRVVAGLRKGARLTHILTESASGREAWAAPVFIDATGNGDLAARAGCGFDVGHPETGLMQPMSLIALVDGIRFGEIEPFVGGSMKEPKQRLLAEMRRAGVNPSYEKPTLFRIHEDLFALMANHEYGASGQVTDSLTRATIRARSELHRIVGAMRRLGPPWEGMRIVATAEQIGIREGRRIHGRHTVTLDEMRAGARHEDAVCRVSFGIDVHALDPKQDRGIESHGHIRPYDVPYRSLVARDADNLLLAGRCISGDFFAHASYRVTGYSVAMGEAAGAAAAVAARARRMAADLPWAEIAPVLASARDPEG